MPINLSQIETMRSNAVPLSRQLYVQLHQQILRGNVIYKEKLPPTRQLATQLKLSRGVVIECYEMLKTDGLVAGFGKGGTIVRYQPRRPRLLKPSSASQKKLSLRGESMSEARHYENNAVDPLPLTPGVPDHRLFPTGKWHSCYKLAFKEAPQWYQREGGLTALKQALSNYLAQYRGIEVTNLDSLMITTGTQSALGLLARMLADPGDNAVLEQPCWPGAEASLKQAEVTIKYAELAAKSLPATKWRKIFARFRPKLILVSPAIQFPTGQSMGPVEREVLLEMSQENSCWIIEDDYAAEYCYSQHPPPSILAHNATSQAIHVGTMSKLLFPGLRIGWLLVPEYIAPRINNALNTSGLTPSYPLQQQLAHFIQYGHLASHLAHSRAIYNERRDRSAEHIRKHASGLLIPTDGISGMNQYFQINGEVGSTKNFVANLRQENIGCDVYFPRKSTIKNPHLLLGHANLIKEDMPAHLHRLYTILKRHIR